MVFCFRFSRDSFQQLCCLLSTQSNTALGSCSRQNFVPFTPQRSRVLHTQIRHLFVVITYHSLETILLRLNGSLQGQVKMKVTRTIMKSIEKHVRVFIECFPPLPRRIKRNNRFPVGQKKNISWPIRFFQEWGKNKQKLSFVDSKKYTT